MEITKEQFNQTIRKAFESGETWGVTYSTWFTPSEKNTEDKKDEAVKEAYNSLSTKKD